jgi:hypothetical protein
MGLIVTQGAFRRDVTRPRHRSFGVLIQTSARRDYSKRSALMRGDEQFGVGSALFGFHRALKCACNHETIGQMQKTPAAGATILNKERN